MYPQCGHFIILLPRVGVEDKVNSADIHLPTVLQKIAPSTPTVDINAVYRVDVFDDPVIGPPVDPGMTLRDRFPAGIVLGNDQIIL